MDKHMKNKLKKLRTLRRSGAVCSECAATIGGLDGTTPVCHPNAEWLTPDDPRWVQVVNKAKRHLPAVPRVPIVVGPTPIPKPKFDLDRWVEATRRRLTLRGFDPERLTYAGRSKVLSTKAGRRKCNEHHKFVITPPIEAPFLEEDETVHLWHGTSLQLAADILVDGFRPSVSGMLGPGVYMGKISKARGYAGKYGRDFPYGLMLKVEASLGTVTEDKDDYTADTCYCPAGKNRYAWGGYIRRAEWCVRDPVRVVVRELHVMKKV